MKKSCLFAVFAWILILCLASCKVPTGTDPGDDPDDRSATAHSISLGQMEHGTIMAPDSAEEGEIVDLTVSPDDGYLLVEGSITVTKAGGGSVAVDNDGYTYSFVMPGTDVTIAAEFEESIVPTYKVQIGTFEGGSVGVNLSPAPEGTNIRLTIDAWEGWELQEISATRDDNGGLPLELSGEGSERYFLMPASNVTVEAVFAMTLFNITIDPSLANGSITADVSTAVIGTAITLTVTPDANFVLTPGSLKVNDGSVTVSGSGKTYIFVMPASDVAVTAEFADVRNSIESFTINGQAGIIDQQEKTIVLELEFSLGMNLTGLKPVIELDSPSAVVSPASQASVNFTNPVEYKVTSQSGDVRTYNVTVTIEEPETPVYYVRIGTFEGGSVNVDYSPVFEDTELCLTINTEEGWEFISISVTMDDDGDLPVELSVEGSKRYFSMPASDVTVNAVFEKIPYNISIATLSNGNITADASTAVIGTVVNLTVSPDANYELKTGSLKVNDGSVTVNGSWPFYSFTMPASDVSVSAQFVDTRNSIDSFSINGTAGTIDQTARTITVELEFSPGLNKANLTPIIVLDSPAATVSPASGVSNNFSSPVKYSVKSESGSIKEYTVTVNVLGQGTIAIKGPGEEDITFIGVSQPLVLSKNGIGGFKTVTIVVTDTYSSIQWYVDAVKRPETGNTLILDASNYDTRPHSLTAMVFKGSTPYSKMIPFTVIGTEPEPGVLIWQVAGATDGAVSHSFVELYNTSDTDIPLSGYTLQYSSSSGAAWEKIDLTGTIKAEHSFFILGKEGTANPDIRLQLNPADPKNTGNLKADMITNLELSNRALKVALIHGDKLLAVADPFTADGGNPVPGYVDMVGAVNDSTKDTIDAFEGTVSEGYSKQKSLRRNSFTDTNNNSADFDIVSYNVIPSLHIDSYRPRGTAFGQWDPLDIPALPPSTTPILILQAGAGKDGAFSHSFVELYNPTASDIALTGYTIQYSSAAGAVWEKIDLTGTIKAKHSFFILGRMGTVVAGTTRLNMDPSLTDNQGIYKADMTCDLFLSNDQFKVALIQGTALLNVANPFTADAGGPITGYIDMLGAVNPPGAIDAFEGTAMPKISKQQTARRVSLNDTNNNAYDFTNIDYRSVVVDQYRPRGTAFGSWNPCP